MNKKNFSVHLLLVTMFFSFDCVRRSSTAGEMTVPQENIASNLDSNSSDEKSDVIAVNCVGRIERQLDKQSNPVYVVDVSGLTLEGAKKYRLNLKIVNPYDEVIQFSYVGLTCGCAKFETAAKEFPALGAADFVLDIDVPNQTKLLFGRVTASFYSHVSEVTPVLRMDVSYTLNGVFGFHGDRAVIEVPPDQAVVSARFPVILVPPITLDKLELEYSENIRDFGIRIISDDPESEVPYIRIDVARQAVPRQGMTGEFGLRRIGSEKKSGVIVSFKHQEEFSIRPESLRLTRENHSKPFRAVAMLRVRESQPELTAGSDEITKKDHSKVSAMAPEVTLAVDGRPARVHVQSLGRSGLYRLTIEHDGPLEAGAEGKVNVRWKLRMNGQEHEIESHAFLPNQ
jgi:hypothetical protein